MASAKHPSFAFFVIIDSTVIFHNVQKENYLDIKTNIHKTNNINIKSSHLNKACLNLENSYQEIKIIEFHIRQRIIHIKNHMIDFSFELLFINNYEDRYPACCIMLASDGSFGQCPHKDGVFRRA